MEDPILAGSSDPHLASHPGLRARAENMTRGQAAKTQGKTRSASAQRMVTKKENLWCRRYVRRCLPKSAILPARRGHGHADVSHEHNKPRGKKTSYKQERVGDYLLRGSVHATETNSLRTSVPVGCQVGGYLLPTCQKRGVGAPEM